MSTARVPLAMTRDRQPEMVPAPLKIEARGVSQVFRHDDGWLTALNDVSMAARSGEFISLVGPSGCGKSTLFAVLAGLQHPSAGEVRLDGSEVTGKLGLVGYMPQKDLLLPWKSVLDNTAIGLRLVGVGKKEARSIAREQFPRFGLDGFEEVYPSTLSGGMRQRAALLRTFLCRREVLLLDEPFGALDALTRADLQQWLLEVWSGSQKTIILVTHDVDEAIYLSDRVYVMTPRPGTIAVIVPIELPRPRQYDATVITAAFTAVKQQVLTLLKGPHPERR